MNITIEFSIFKLIEVPNISLNWPNLRKKNVFLVENRKSEHNHWILHIRISLGAKFQCNSSFDFWTKIYPERIFLVENRKSKHYHWILDIQISVTTKFQFRQPILNFGTKFAQKRYFCIFELDLVTMLIFSAMVQFVQKEYLRSKTEKLHFCVRSWSLFNIRMRLTETKLF